MVSHHLAKFGGHWHCGSGAMSLVAEKEYSCFNPPLLFISKDTVWKHTPYHINDSDPGHTRLKQQLKKNLKITFASPPKNAAEKKKEK